MTVKAQDEGPTYNNNQGQATPTQSDFTYVSSMFLTATNSSANVFERFLNQIPARIVKAETVYCINVIVLIESY